MKAYFSVPGNRDPVTLDENQALQTLSFLQLFQNLLV